MNDICSILDEDCAFLFDLDGTLADTERYHWFAYNELLKKQNLSLKKTDMCRYIGNPEREIYKKIREEYSANIDDETFLNERLDTFKELIKRTCLKPYLFISELLDAFKSHRDMYIVSSQRPEIIEFVLEELNLDSYFEKANIFSCHDNRFSKKDIYRDPDKFFKKNYKSIVLFEDSDEFLALGKYYGFSTVGIEHLLNEGTLEHADIKIKGSEKIGVFIGLAGLDLTYYPSDSFPLRNNKLKVDEYNLQIGGPAANAAQTFSSLGNKAVLISSIGNSGIAEFIKNELGTSNILTLDLTPNKRFPDISSILVSDDGSRTIISGQGQKVLNLTSDFSYLIENADIIEYDGNLYGIEQMLMECVGSYHKTLLLDVGSYKQGFRTCFTLNTIAIASESYKDLDNNSVFSHADDLMFTATTHGENNIEYWDGSAIKHIAPKKVKAISTLGAGDVLHGAFAHYFVEGNDCVLALDKASKFATYFVQKKDFDESLSFAIEEIQK